MTPEYGDMNNPECITWWMEASDAVTRMEKGYWVEKLAADGLLPFSIVYWMFLQPIHNAITGIFIIRINSSLGGKEITKYICSN